MSEVGKIVTAAIVWFQFIMAQLLTAILLSEAIATEIRHRTLDALLVTPISDVQIVMDKLVSGLLQLVLLLAISLPLLAIIRVFGGVPWSFLVCGLCLTFATAVLVGALSLFLSVTNRQTHQVATNAVGVCTLFWFCTGMLIAVLVQTSRLNNSTATGILDLTSPYVVLFRQTRAMLLASGPGPVVFPWPVHCLVALGAAGGCWRCLSGDCERRPPARWSVPRPRARAPERKNRVVSPGWGAGPFVRSRARPSSGRWCAGLASRGIDAGF